jgi:hypothetical protein
MTARSRRATALVAGMAFFVAACEREERRFRESPPSASPTALVAVSDLQPGPTLIRTTVEEPYGDIAYSVSEGSASSTG